MTLNSLEVTKCCKKNYSIFAFCLQIFQYFIFYIFRIIFGRTCYGTTVYAHRVDIIIIIYVLLFDFTHISRSENLTSCMHAQV